MRKYIGEREFIENFQTFIYRNDAQGEEWELPINCEIEHYHGNIHNWDDDPSETFVYRCKIGETNGPFLKNTEIELTEEENETVCERYLRTK